MCSDGTCPKPCPIQTRRFRGSSEAAYLGASPMAPPHLAMDMHAKDEYRHGSQSGTKSLRKAASKIGSNRYRNIRSSSIAQ